jgi:drug/metabolite transporter (DMT)-like permease
MTRVAAFATALDLWKKAVLGGVTNFVAVATFQNCSALLLPVTDFLAVYATVPLVLLCCGVIGSLGHGNV